MLPMYREADQRIAEALESAARDGIVPTCHAGCDLCCRQAVNASVTEVAAIAEYVERTLSAHALAGLRRRLDAWRQWVECDLLWLIEIGLSESEAFKHYGPMCPLLVDGQCSAYAVRPLVCRAHYVVSDAQLCGPQGELHDKPATPEAMDDVAQSARPVAKRLRAMIEASGQDFHEAVDLLPAGLAKALGGVASEGGQSSSSTTTSGSNR
jgi:Fe-S-cluster containining protein